MVSRPHYRLWVTGLLLVFLSTPLLADNAQRVRCGFLVGHEYDRAAKLGAGIQAERPRPDLPEFADSPDGFFRVHYTRVGDDAVPPDDADLSGTPDYVEAALEALQRSWTLQQDYQAPPTPPLDGMAGGSPALDVYLRNLATEGQNGAGLYGETVLDSLLKGRPEEPWPRFTSWIEVDNDFSPADTNVYGDTVFATFGVEGLQITCAHELHHVAQLADIGNAGVQLMLYEQMSTYMELVCYPESKDWVVYASRFFRTPAAYALSDPTSLNGYVWGWFPTAWQDLDQRIFAEIFEGMRNGLRPFAALVGGAENTGQPLDSVFVRTLPSMFHTGSRGAENSLLMHADSIPEIAWHLQENVSPPSTLTTGRLRAFEVRAFQFTVPSLSGNAPVTASVMLTWPDTDAFQESVSPQRKNYTLTVTSSPISSDIPIAGSAWGIRVQPDELAVWIDNVATKRPSSPYPQPVRVLSDPLVHVPVLDALPGDEATVTLMTVQTLGVALETLQVELDGDKIVVPLTVPTNLTPGTYLVQVECNGRTDIHKLMVRR